MKFIMVSNYINHHQIPFCNAMSRELAGDFLFIQTEPMEEERVRMGWQADHELSYVRYFYKEPEECTRLIMDARAVLFGGTDEESYIRQRLEAGKPVIRYSERMYKTGQWKAVSPRGLVKKYQDHTRYRKGKVYLLCSGGYVPSDFHIVRAYPGKMFRWGYFPETRHYDVNKLMEGKGAAGTDSSLGRAEAVSILWAARLIGWKHPELAVRTAAWLKQAGCSFHLDMIGVGELESDMKRLVKELQLEDCVSLLGVRKPEEVREHMERADIYLVTSDRNEGWGAVLNEAMNSGCAVVSDSMVGAAPYLIRHMENGALYQSGREQELFGLAELLCRDRKLRQKLGRSAYRTIVNTWNGENAAGCLLELCGRLGILDTGKAGLIRENGPCSAAEVVPERKMYRMLVSRQGEE